ncbi:hypothetical protein MJO29_003383 [Puccinia striiformis f. sp. tritici]|nr:hypothetical protein Pst134EB_005831 [Puccinia striiformis f. sp. tritici]KAI7965285.1 hypothetical protein MJO29_003383 [Puccinia striiformis f. sp. tritici]
MKIQQLITALGLCLSQALAGPVDKFEPQIKSIVVDLTEHRFISDNPASGTKLNDALHMNLHEPVAAQNTQEFYDAIDPLLNVDKENTKIFMDIRAAHEDTMRDNFGAHPEVRATRLRVYQNAMYSRLRDIVQDGDGKPVEEALNTLHRYAKSLINKHFNEASESQTLHRSSSKTRGSFEYRTTGQINKDLAKTNGDVPQARLIDGTNLEAFGKFLISHAEEQYKLRFGPVSKKE